MRLGSHKPTVAWSAMPVATLWGLLEAMALLRSRLKDRARHRQRDTARLTARRRVICGGAPRGRWTAPA